MSRSPNVIFVLTDDQGYPPLGCHGHPYVQTPALDVFHDKAVRFDQFHTGTTCAPTRAGLLTGHYCNSTGVWHTIGGRSLLRGDEWTLATALREQGYRTGIFGKWHLGDEYPYRPQDRGFETTVIHAGGGISQQPDWWGNDYFDDTYLVNGQPQPFDGYCTDVFFSEARRFIEQHRDQPFFCFISTNAPHNPFNVEARYRELYRDSTSSELYARFLGMVTNIDENFGRLRQTLRELAIEEDTILVFMSDNGQTEIFEPVEAMYTAGLRGLKGSPYDGGHRVPFFMRWPGGGLDGGRTVDALTAYIDVMPTLLDLCGIDPPTDRSFHGRSLTPLLRAGEPDPSWRERVLVTDTQRVPHPIKWRRSCVMQDRWRLVNFDELYDLAADPGQTCNLTDRHPRRVASMRAAYDAWWALCARQMADDIPVTIGAAGQGEAVLRSHDLRNEQDQAVVYEQGQVREGVVCHGYWEVRVEQAGDFEIELRRWPKEAGHGIREGIEGTDIVYREHDIAPGSERMYTGGEALSYSIACLDITGLPQQSVEIGPRDAAAVFRVHLDAGPYHVRARFSECAGRYSSAYYLYIRPTAT